MQQAYNAVGQLCEIAPTATGCGDSTYYAGGFSYNAPGKLLGFNYGNGVTGTFLYSPDRTQLVDLAYSKGNATYFSLQYSYRKSSAYSPPCQNGTAGNNGSIQCITDNVSSGRSASYGYDPLKRMSSALTCGSSAYPQWGLSESYDRFGNRLSQALTAGSGPSTSMSFNGNNQPVGYTYDPSGNMTVEPLSPPNYMTWDGESRMTAFQGFGGAAGYSYDGHGMRVVKSVQGGTTTVSIFSGSQVIAEYDNGAATASPSREYIYNGAGDTTGLLAMIAGCPSACTATYYHQDHLSVRLTTDGNGNILSQQGTFPFGESWYSNLGPGENWVFTSYDRDAESGLDYALARYYDSRTGTMCSADPVAGSPTNPRRIFDETALNELAESIRTQGMLSPLLVRPINPQTYEVVAGRRRFRAAQRAGVESVPADIRELTDAQCLEIAIVENLQRRDVQPLEEAEGFVSFSRLPVCPSSVATHDVSERLD